MSHTFHIPVLGLGFSIDTPLKVARYGITSTLSIVDDILVEEMRLHYAALSGIACQPISDKEEDYRARRIRAYLDLVHDLVQVQFETLKNQDPEGPSDLHKHLELLPDEAPAKKIYQQYLSTADPAEKQALKTTLLESIHPGAIDVNIMSKVDKLNKAKDGSELGAEFSDACAALRGYAGSRVHSSVVLSAGMNPRLYSYLEAFDDFYPDAAGYIAKKVILKVSDYRSAFIQGKFLAKKGIWVSEYRVESGLNCGGHAFATQGYLMGPILEEFKNKRAEMQEELRALYAQALLQKDRVVPSRLPAIRLSAQGGIGTSEENRFLLDYYQLDSTGWGSPFLLVPEASQVDETTLHQLAASREEDYYLSGASPLGVPFNNFRKSSAEVQRLERIAQGRPGSPCTKKLLVSDTEFTKEPICTASRKYQHLKIRQLKEQHLPIDLYQEQFDQITEKLCLCEGLCASARINLRIPAPEAHKAVAICPGPNLAYFRGVYSLEEMVKHIYGKLQLFDAGKRPHMFLKELKLYIDYLRKDFSNQQAAMDTKKRNYFEAFRKQLENGIAYYRDTLQAVYNSGWNLGMRKELDELEQKLKLIGV
jgi:hypothetical protein